MGTAASTAATATNAAVGAAARAFRPAGLLPLPPGAATVEPLTVVTYNILADKYATGGMHQYCPPQYLAWPYRKQRIIEELLGFKADILCLQEVERPFFERELEPLMQQHGYEALYYARRKTYDPPSVPEEGIGLLYRTERLERQASKAVRLADCVQQGQHGKFWQSVRAREDGVLLALLRDRRTQRQLLAGCTHLFWDPKFPDIKAAQAALMCRAVETFMRQQRLSHEFTQRRDASALPMVLCGDFNSLPRKSRSDAFDTVPPGRTLTSGAYQLLSDPAGVDSTHRDHPQQRQRQGQLAQLHLTSGALRLESAAVAAWGREPPVTNKTAGFAGCLDYVWLSRHHWAVSAALQLPYRFDVAAPGRRPAVVDPDDVADLGPIPNEQFPSDHLALGFQLHLKPASAADSSMR